MAPGPVPAAPGGAGSFGSRCHDPVASPGGCGRCLSFAAFILGLGYSVSKAGPLGGCGAGRGRRAAERGRAPRTGPPGVARSWAGPDPRQGAGLGLEPVPGVGGAGSGTASPASAAPGGDGARADPAAEVWVGFGLGLDWFSPGGGCGGAKAGPNPAPGAALRLLGRRRSAPGDVRAELGSGGREEVSGGERRIKNRK